MLSFPLFSSHLQFFLYSLGVIPTAFLNALLKFSLVEYPLIDAISYTLKLVVLRRFFAFWILSAERYDEKVSPHCFEKHVEKYLSLRPTYSLTDESVRSLCWKLSAIYHTNQQFATQKKGAPLKEAPCSFYFCYRQTLPSMQYGSSA